MASSDSNDAKQRALEKFKLLRDRLTELEAAAKEPIAIVGIGCKFPSGADGHEAFWRGLVEGRDASREVPADRWSVDAVYSAHAGEPGKMVTRRGSFVDDPSLFDPYFFGITPREALGMDPQQRWLLEVAHEALEDAGLPRQRYAGSACGVYIGICNWDYSRRADLHWENCSSTGLALSIAANRVSYALDLCGPSVAIDTACSSSLVALDLACTHLRARRTDLALAGGVNAILAPDASIFFSQLRALSRDGRCKTFDARADGYARGEGCGVVVLKRVSDAVRDGDRIWALVLGSAVNQDGFSSGLTVPNGLAQESVLRSALKSAGVLPSQVRYVEAHGTGTVLGDPVEVMALSSVLSEGRAEGSYCALGSVKTNIGHLESAAGIAGIVKTVLSLHAGKLPASLHYKEPNPHIPFGEIPLRVQRELGDWPPGEGPRVAGVSSFGFGGTNAHVVLSEAPAEAESESREGTYAYCVSARTEEALQGSVKAHASWLRGHVEVSFSDASYTSSVRRTHHEERVVVVASSREEAAEKLESQRWRRGRTEGTRRSKVAFVMSGQGPQWPGMGRELHRKERVYREAVEEVAAAIVSAGGPRVLEETGRLDETEVTQPALFALQVGVCAQWASWGLKPDVVVGHSIGEVAAAYVSGVLSLESASRLVVARGRAMQRATGLGKMASVRMSRESLTSWLREHGYWGRVGIGAHNGPETTVLSGEREAVEEVVKGLEGAKLLPVNYAFHSGQMESLSREFGLSVSWLRGTRGSVPWVSTQTGEEVSGETLSGEYWVTQMRQPVEFAKAMGRVYGMGVDHVVEVSPHPVLVPALQEQIDAGSHRVTVLSTLRRRENERGTMLDTLGALHVAGYPVDWAASHAGRGRVVSLPTYAWQRQRYWLSPERTPRQTSAISLNHLPWLAGHRIADRVLYPGSAFMEAMLAATHANTLHEVTFLAPLALDERSVELETLAASGSLSIASRATADASLVIHARGTAKRKSDLSPPAPADLEAVRARAVQILDGDAVYKALRDKGLDYGGLFRGIRRCWRCPNEVVATVTLDEAAAGFVIHPALLDSIIQCVIAATPDADPKTSGLAALASIGELTLYASSLPLTVTVHAIVHESSADGVRGSLVAYDEAGRPLLAITDLVGRRAAVAHAAPRAAQAWRTEHVEAPLPDGGLLPELPDGAYLIVRGANDSTLATTLATTLASRIREAGRVVVECTVTDDASDDVLGGVPEVAGIISLLGASERPDASLSEACRATLALTQALARKRPSSPPRLLLVTRGQAAHWGFCISAALELPQVRTTTVDVDVDVDGLLRELVAKATEPQVFLRGGRRLTPSLASVDLPGAAIAPSADGVHLVTGAFGGLGSTLARALVARGARDVVLAGRTAREDDPLLAELRGSGARVEAVALDTGDADAVARLVGSLGDRPLRGVFHAAGGADDASLVNMNAASFETSALLGKVTGAEALDRATRGKPLEFFVLFSSASALAGNPGQAAYVAANAALDAIARARRARGERALSIQWGPWRDVGMSARRDLAARFEARGVRPLDPQAAIHSLFALAATDYAVAAVIDRDLRPVRPRGDVDVSARLVDVFAKLGAISPSRLKPDTAIQSLGLDSIMMVELQTMLRSNFGIAITVTDIFRTSTLGELSTLVRGLLGGSASAQDRDPADERPLAAPAPVVEVRATKDVSALSDDEVRAALTLECEYAEQRKHARREIR